MTLSTPVRQDRFILDGTGKWVSWEQEAACSRTCNTGYDVIVDECCSSGDNRVCLTVPWNIVKPMLTTCTANATTYSLSRTSPSSTRDTPVSSAASTANPSTVMTATSASLISVSSNAAPLSPLTYTSLSSPPSSSSSSSLRPQTSSVLPSSSLALSSSTPLPSTSTPAIQTITSLTSTSTVTTTTPQQTTPPQRDCSVSDGVSCGFTFNIVCTTSGKVFANLCMLAKAACHDQTLRQKPCSG
ncbi:uncharacterized protein LOC128233719 [Mya arenaria]|uniref:uncharacterized protein LOC128233719 n=1 Tax=Mya arenaria TaxID=6604 RepID=UPI0022E32848|nr:uncharacterized protein LOC128233719 [Mya arenaria]